MAKRPIVHLDIPAVNRLEAAKFYHDAFGWDIENVEEKHYTVFHSGNVRGGFPNVDNEHVKPDDMIVYLESDDIEADLKLVEEIGGKALSGKMDIPGVGSYAYFADPTGNRLGFWKVNRK